MGKKKKKDKKKEAPTKSYAVIGEIRGNPPNRESRLGADRGG